MGLRIRAGWSLSIILLIAFALELVAVLSVPVTKSISLCEYGDYQFGVFGYCNKKTNECSPVGIGYDVSNIDNKFSLPSNARRSLANLLIVHVVAAGLTLILLILSLLTHIHGPANSSRYLLFVLIFSIPAFLLSLLAFLVDIILFVSHMSWGGWIILVSTILLAVSGVLLCVMRRRLSSQKAMRRRMNDTSELADMQFPGPAAQHPSGGFEHHRGSATDFAELKYETSPSNVTNNTDEPSTNDKESRYTQHSMNDSYQYAASRAYRGTAGRRTPDQYQHQQGQNQNPNQNQGTLATATERMPEGQFPQQQQQQAYGQDYGQEQIPMPAGTYGYDDQVSERGLPVGNTYGPNVVPIPRLKDSEYRQPEYHTASQPPQPPQHGYQEYAGGYDEAQVHDQSGHSQEPSDRIAENEQQHQQPATYIHPLARQARGQRTVSGPRPPPQAQAQAQYQASNVPEEQSLPAQPYNQQYGQNQNAYVPPRRQWQHAPNQPDNRQPRPPSSRTSSGSRQDHRQYFVEDQMDHENRPQQPHYTSQHDYRPQQPSHYASEQQQQAAPYQPTRSEEIIKNNPDFQLAPPGKPRAQKGAQAQGPLPSSASGSSGSSSANNKRHSKNKGMPAAFATNDSPFSITRGV